MVAATMLSVLPTGVSIVGPKTLVCVLKLPPTTTVDAVEVSGPSVSFPALVTRFAKVGDPQCSPELIQVLASRIQF